jgi:chaperonin GroEL
VATAVDRVGKNGSVTIEEARSLETTLDLVEGFRFSSGYVATAFVTDERRSAVRYEDPLFFITDFKIESVQDILPALEIAARENRPFVIVADEVDGQALAALIMNSVRGTMKVAAIKAPSYGEERITTMSDLALATGATFLRQSAGDKIANVSLTDFGSAKSVEITKYSTIVVDGDSQEEQIADLIENIKDSVKECPDLHEAERLHNRLAMLTGGVAIIRVGASTEVEMIEKKHRVEDALEAVHSAQLEGVIPGGGLTLFTIAKNLSVDFANKEQETALSIFKEALQAPLCSMAENAGLSPEVVVMKLNQLSDSNLGFNFATGEIVKMVESGIVDPAKVARCALKNAVSVAGTLLLTNHGIVEI